MTFRATQWLCRAAHELEDLPSGWLQRIENLTWRIDPHTAMTELNDIMDALGDMANASGLIEPLPLREKSPFIWTDINCYGFIMRVIKKLKVLCELAIPMSMVPSICKSPTGL